MRYITIKEEPRPIIFNLLALRNFCKEKGIEEVTKMDAIFTGFESGEFKFDQMDDLTKLALYGFKEGARQEGKKFDLTFEDLYVFLFDDIATLKNFNEVIDAIKDFSQSMSKKEEPGEEVPQVPL